MATPLVLALDIGTSSVRALLFDQAGRPVGGLVAERTAAVIDEVLTAAGSRAGDLRAVGLSTFWHGLLGRTRRTAR